MRRFENKVMLITGAAGGIGFAVAEQAAKEGAKIVFVDMKENEGAEALAKLRRYHAEIDFLRLDLTLPESAEKFCDFALNKYGRIDILINNAGIAGKPGLLEQVDVENFRRVFECNVITMLLCSQYAVRAMLQREGTFSIVNVSSIAGMIGFPGNHAYVASKHAVIGLTKGMALDYAARGIRVNAVCPGIIRTPMQEKSAQYLEKAEKRQEQRKNVPVKTISPQNRIAEPEEVAAAILFLASREASHINGAVLPVDGGITAY